MRFSAAGLCQGNLLRDVTEYDSISDEIQKVELFLRYYVKAPRLLSGPEGVRRF
jgi:hypothetical protein